MSPSLSKFGAIPRSNCGQIYFPALDGLRAVAFLMVFGMHYLALPWGNAGVDVFFVLSGFLITGILLDTRNSPHRARTFYVRRSLRIFPLFYGSMALLLLTYPIFRWQWSAAWLVWPVYIGNYVRWLYPARSGSPLELLADGRMVSSSHPGAILYLGHFWSLCIEEQFYLVWPWVVFSVKSRRKLIYICVAAALLCPLVRIVLNVRLPDALRNAEVLYRTTPLRVDALLLGGLVALVRRGRYRQNLLLAARVICPILVATFILWHVMNRSVWHSLKDYRYGSYTFTWGLSVVDLFVASLLVLALEPGSLMYRIFTIYPLRWLGRISYGAYVFHDIFHPQIVQLTSAHMEHWRIPSTALALVFTVIVSWLSYRWFELPFIRMKERLAPEQVRTYHAELNV